ncbi:MAG: PAS domain S-box protein, partial [Candidatus Bathyarchaeota archaeon]|nr:PAS domain S-box protein [Candidatus Bathyarchaeota archaeon]
MDTMGSAADSLPESSVGPKARIIRVLYVDDDASFLTTTKQILEITKLFEVDTALLVNEAKQKIAQTEYDVVVSDYQMPEKDGLMFLNELRENGNDVPFILFTGKGKEEVAIKALNLGADYYINKSGHPETVYSQLIHYIKQAVEKKNAEEKLKYKLEFESVISRISSRFVNPPDINKAIHESLADIGIISGASRVYIFLLRKNRTVISNTHEWCKKGTTSDIKSLQNLPVEQFPYLIENLREGKKIQINDTSTISKEAHFERQMLESRNIKSLVVLPIKVSGELAGFVGLTSLEKTDLWSSDDVSLLQIVSELIGNTFEHKKTEEKLKDNEKKYRLMTENTTDAIFIQDMSLNVTYVSPSIETLSGYTPDEVYKIKPHEFMTPESFERGVTDFKEALMLASKDLDAEIPLKQYEYRRKDGSTFWGELKTKVLHDSKGNLVGLQGTLRDITERKKTEEKLKESEKKYRLIAENITDVVFIQGLDLRIKYVSPSVEALTGYTPEEVMKLHPKQFVAPSSYDAAEKNWKNAIENADKQPENESRLMQYEYLKKDGSTFWGELKVKLLRDSEGRLIGTQGTMRDVTERKKTEERLMESEKKYRLLTENTSDVLFIQNPDLSIRYISPSITALSGYTPEEVIKLGPKNLMPPESYEKGAADFKEAIQMIRKTPDAELPYWCYEYIRKDGTKRWGEFKAKFLRDSEGNIICMQGILRDVTDRKKVEDALQRERKMLELITANIGAGLTIISKDYEILWMNKFLKTNYGNAIGKKCYFTYNDYKRVCPGCGAKKIFETGQEHVVHEQRVPGSSGKREWIEIVANPIKDEKGNIIAASELTVRLSDIKRMEKKLGEAEKRYHMLFDKAPLGILIVDRNGFAVEFNEEAHNQLGYSREEFGNLTVFEYEAELSNEEVKKRIQELIDAGKGEFITKHRAKTGEVKEFENIIQVIELEGKKYLHVIKKDVTDQKKAKEELDDLVDKLVKTNEKLGVVGKLTRHDARNKLAIIQNSIYLAKMQLGNNKEPIQNLDSIESAIEKLEKIFSFARMYEMLGTTELEYINVKTCVDEAAMLHSDTNKITVTNECKGLTVLADSLLRQLFYNLIDDSLKHGETVSNIKVYFTEEKHQLRVTYEDDGIGIPEEEKEKIFMERYGKGTG